MTNRYLGDSQTSTSKEREFLRCPPLQSPMSKKQRRHSKSSSQQTSYTTYITLLTQASHCCGQLFTWHMATCEKMTYVVASFVKSASMSNLEDSQNTLLYDTLCLWVACRLGEGKWRLCSGEHISAPTTEQESPFFNQTPNTPMMLLQINHIVLDHIIQPLRKKVLRDLQKMMPANDLSN